MILLCATASLAANEDGDGIIEPGESEVAELARATQNPVANLISLPFQNNTAFDFGPRERTQNVLNIQPVLPFEVNEDWNLITRTIFPIASQPSFQRGQDRQNGVGDTTITMFASPVKPIAGRVLVGAGPVLLVPTASDDRLGLDAWGMGLSGVFVVNAGPFVTGTLVTHVWNLEGQGFKQFLMQPFVNFNLPDGWFIASAPVITADFDQRNDAWEVPVGGGIGKIFRLGKLPLNLAGQAFYNAEQRQFGADWSLRITLSMLFPKKQAPPAR
jgi:hypothetical protein